MAHRQHLLLERSARVLQLLGGLRERDLGAGELVTPRARLQRVAEYGCDAAAVLAREPFDRGKALFERVERDLRAETLDEVLETVGRCPLAVVAELSGELVRLDRERAHPLT